MQTIITVNRENPFYNKVNAHIAIVDEVTDEYYKKDRLVVIDNEIYKLSPYALSLIMFIMCRASRYTDHVQLMVSYISRETGMSRPTVNKAIKELIEKEYLQEMNNKLFWINITKLFKY